MFLRYTCLDPTRKVVSLKTNEDLQYDVLDVTCLFNGRWDRDIEMYACSGECSLLIIRKKSNLE